METLFQKEGLKIKVLKELIYNNMDVTLIEEKAKTESGYEIKYYQVILNGGVHKNTMDKKEALEEWKKSAKKLFQRATEGKG